VPVDELRIDLPPDLARVIMILLEKDPANRFPDAESVVTALSSGIMPTLRTAQAPASVPAYGMIGSQGLSGFGAQRESMSRGTVATRTGSGSRCTRVPSTEELDRWNAEPVRKFRKKLAPYLAVNAIIIPVSIFGDTGFFTITAIWSIMMAVQYSKLWQEGYNWRDVFRQPRDRLIFDVAAETIDDARALFDETKREQVRARARARASEGLFPENRGASPAGNLLAGGSSARMPRSPLPGERSPAPLPVDNSPYGSALASIRMDRDEIYRQLQTMTKDEKDQIPDVAGSADAIYRRGMQVASALAELDLRDNRDTPEAIEKEITRLEAQANPLDYRASEERVRRLAHLKRQRRVVADLAKKRTEAETKLEHCRQLLRSMRLELLRYRSAGMGGVSNGLTMVTQQAQVVVKEMGYLSDAAAEVNAL